MPFDRAGPDLTHIRRSATRVLLRSRRWSRRERCLREGPERRWVEQEQPDEEDDRRSEIPLRQLLQEIPDAERGEPLLIIDVLELLDRAENVDHEVEEKGYRRSNKEQKPDAVDNGLNHRRILPRLCRPSRRPSGSLRPPRESSTITSQPGLSEMLR